MTAKETLDAVDLDELSDAELIDHLERVSGALKSRNSLFPKAGGPSVTEMIESVLRHAADPSPSRR